MPTLPWVAPAGTVKVMVRLEALVPLAMTTFLATCSPVSVRAPLALKSTQAFKKAAAPLVLVTVTVREAEVPWYKEVGTTTPSSSARLLRSSPVALLSTMAEYSESVRVPINKLDTCALPAEPKRA